MGRRVEMRTGKEGAETLQRFVYDNYLCIQHLRGADNALLQSYVWDPTEPIASRPLVFIPSGGEVSYYFHDGNKNVSDLVDIHGSVIHYAYTPFGAPTASAPSENPFRFSSEVYDETPGLVYYNYRHYNPADGRWCGRDPLMERGGGINLHGFLTNNPIFLFDDKGRSVVLALKATTITSLLCAVPQAVAVVIDYPESGDKFKHCVTSCRIAKTCGVGVMEIVGLSKELRDRAVAFICRKIPSLQGTFFCNGGHGDVFDSFQDLKANHPCVGWEGYVFGVVGSWVGTIFRQSCECCCDCKVGREN